MPNWCSNYLRIAGNAGQVAALAESVIRPDPERPGESVFDFEGIYPIPEELLNEDRILCGKDELRWAAFGDDISVPFAITEISDESRERLEDALPDIADWNARTVGEINRCLSGNLKLQEAAGIRIDTAKTAVRRIQLYGATGWYDWCIIHWGTKWNAQECRVSQSEGLLEISFETAWSPPEGVYRAICAAYPDLDLELVGKYIEEGMCFAGFYDNIGSDLYDNPCSDEEYRQFAIEHFGYEYEDEEDDDDEDE